MKNPIWDRLPLLGSYRLEVCLIGIREEIYLQVGKVHTYLRKEVGIVRGARVHLVQNTPIFDIS